MNAVQKSKRTIKAVETGTRELGFTLIELLIASTLALVLMLTTTTIIFQALEFADRQRLRPLLNEKARQTFDLLGDQGLGQLLNEQWKLKCKMSPRITNGKIDYIFDKGLESGALGGKLLGAGGGGFILFFAKPENHLQIRKTLHKFLNVPFRFEFSGSQIIYFSHHA